MKKTICVIAIAAIAFCIVLSSGAKASYGGKKTAYIFSHAHFDPIWLDSQAGETLRQFAVVRQQLEYAEIEPRFEFSLSEVDYLKPYWDAYPADRVRIVRLAHVGRIDFTGGYNEPDESSTGGEALIRNFVFGKLFKESLFTAEVFTAAQHDVFGHAPQLPQILLGTGHRYSLFYRGSDTDMPTEYYWLSPDGSSILNKYINYSGVSATVSFEGADPKYYELTGNALFMSGADFKEPDRSISLRLKQSKKLDIVSGTSMDFFSAVERDLAAEGKTMPQISRDHNPVFNGCYTSRIDTKLANHLIETLLTDAEKFSTINSITSGAPYPWIELDYAWRQLFFGEHHDGLTGTDNENANLDLLAGWRDAATVASKALNTAISGIASNIDTTSAAPKNGAPVPIVIFNSLNWKRTEPVEVTVAFKKPPAAFRVVDSKGSAVPFQLLSPALKRYPSARIVISAPDVPSMGYLVLYALEAKSFPSGAIPVTKQGAFIENDYYRIEVDPARGGGIKSLYSKKLGREFISYSTGMGNEIFSLEESQKASNPWSLNTTGAMWRSSDYKAESVTVEHGAVRDRIIVRNAARQDPASGRETLPEVVSEIILNRNSPRVDFRTHFNDFKEHDFLFKVGFPAAIENAAPVFEERFATVTRSKNSKTFMLHLDDGPEFSREYPINNWVGLSPSTSITFADENGKPAAQYPLVFGDLIVPKGDSDMMKTANSLSVALAKAGVTSAPTPDDKPRTNSYYGFRIALGHSSNNAYSKKLIEDLPAAEKDMFKTAVEQKGFSFLFVSPPGSATVDRISIPVLIIEGKTKKDLDTAVSGVIAQLGARHEILLPAAVNVTSFNTLMSDAGLELIGNGNHGASIENNGTITLSLMRSSTGSPAGENYSSNWERENWNHVFLYALLPHAGDWDKAGAPRAGYDFNTPLIAIQTDLHKGTLPGKSYSFLNTGNSNVILTSLKPGGYPVIVNMGGINPTNYISIRVYNPGVGETSGDITVAYPIESVDKSDMLDTPLESISNNSNSFSISLSQFKIQTYLVTLKSKKDFFQPPKPTRTAGAVPVYVRYWETNQNVAPAGLMPLSIVLEPNGFSADRKTLNVRVTVAENLKGDRDIFGNVEFELPAGAAVRGDTRFDLSATYFKMLDLQITGLDPRKLEKQFIAARVKYGETEYEDVLTFSNWKMHAGEEAKSAALTGGDPTWETVPLARFWSKAGSESDTVWFTKKLFLPKEMKTHAQLMFEIPKGDEMEVYVNGIQARHEKWGLSYTPTIDWSLLRSGAENQIAVMYKSSGGNAPAWGTAFRGAEAVFNRENIKLKKSEISLRPGSKGSFEVEVFNPFDQPLDGKAVLVSPIETWKEGGVFSLIEISPAARTYRLKPGGGTTLKFDVTIPAGAAPGTHVAMVKTIYKGIVSYSDTVRILIK